MNTAPDLPHDAAAPTPGGAPAPVLHAAREASDFVARLFSEIGSDDAPADVVEAPYDATAEQGPADSAPALIQAAEAVRGLLAGRSVLVLGLGISGLSMARWCLRCGAEVTVADTRAEPPLLAQLRAELPQARFVSGPFNGELVAGQGFSAVLRSPGLTPEELASISIAAEEEGISAGGELGLYSEALAALQHACGYAPRVLAVTGTNGKTTVTALTGQLVAAGGASVAVAGNIGPALLDTLGQAIDSASLPEVWVLELSSFQLDPPARFEPTAATVLNLSQDHLDWHGSMDAYARAKAKVFGTQGLVVLNRDDLAVLGMLPALAAAPEAGAVQAGAVQAGAVQAGAAPKGARAKPAKTAPRAYLTFGAGMPQRPGDYGIELVHGMAWLVRAQEADETRKRAPRRSGAPDVQEELFVQRLMPADALRIRGRHNAVNALAALALAQAGGGVLGPMLHALREYRGEPHRVEPVGVIDGVEYFDDSKGTNVGATVAAISGLGAERRVVAILGGVGKGQDFSPLAAPVARHARAVVLIGRDAPQIRTALAATGVALHDAATLADAVDAAARLAHAGDAVLLSPACASFDMFESYVHRAEVFCALVRERAQDAGQPLEGGA